MTRFEIISMFCAVDAERFKAVMTPWKTWILLDKECKYYDASSSE